MEQININKEGERWVVRFRYDTATKDFVKSLGFWWEPKDKVWYTTDPRIAAKLDPDSATNAVEAVKASRATDSELDIPAPEGLSYFPFQKGGIAYAMARPNTLIADEMGLGKTIQAIGVINVDPSIKKVLVVCPASLKLNWKAELEKWLVRKMSVGVVNGEMPDADVLVINYDILKKWHQHLMSKQFDLMVIDECHKVKNPKAQRTQYLLGKWDEDEDKRIEGIKAKRKVFLTGTPIVNRPIELWPLIRAIDPFGMGRNKMGFAKRYCQAHHNGYGWSFSGAANLEELQFKLRAGFMVRRLKAEVLPELPPKQRQIVVLTPTGTAVKAVQREREVFDRSEKAKEALAKLAAADVKADKEAYAAATAELKTAQKIAFEEMSLVRHETAVAKIPYVIDYLNDALEDGDNKIVVMMHHHDVAHALVDAFPGAAIVTGETAPHKRQAEVDRFQTDPNCRLFVGSIQAAGVGLTLTASSHVVFAELDWVPGNVTQAEDRCHRIGQRDNVLVQHLVFDGSVDSLMASTLVEKQAVIDKALDEGVVVAPTVVEGPVVLPTIVKGPLPTPVTNPGDMSQEQVEAIHLAIKMLAGVCDGASTWDNQGFNKLDTGFGHSLANAPKLSQRQAEAGRKMVLKYVRQIPADLYAIVKG